MGTIQINAPCSNNYKTNKLPNISENQQNIIKEYRIESLIAQVNSNCSLYLCRHLVTEQKFVLRKYTSARFGNNVLQDLDIYEDLMHPSTMKVIEYFKANQMVFFITEYFEGQPLSTYLNDSVKIEEDQIVKIVKQLLTAVNYLKGKKIVNRNITLSNVMYDGNFIKLTNFHRATRYKSGDRLKEMVSGIYYRAPEMIKKRYNSRVDVWAVGVIMYILFTGKPPFDGIKESDIANNILEREVDIEAVKETGASANACDFLSQIFIKNKNKRPKADKLLEHPWITTAKRRMSEFKLGHQFVENIRTFNFKSEFQIAIYTFLVTNLATEYERQIAAKEFQKLDVNNNGLLTKNEIIKGLKRMSITITDGEALSIFNKMDRHNTGIVEYEEFLATFIDREKFMEEENLKLCFDFIDTKKSGAVTLKNLERIFGEMTQTIYVKTMFAKYAKNSYMNKNGFIRMLRQCSSQ